MSVKHILSLSQRVLSLEKTVEEMSARIEALESRGLPQNVTTATPKGRGVNGKNDRNRAKKSRRL